MLEASLYFTLVVNSSINDADVSRKGGGRGYFLFKENTPTSSVIDVRPGKSVQKSQNSPRKFKTDKLFNMQGTDLGSYHLHISRH